MEVVYISHPLSAPTEEERELNAESAQRWAAWVAMTFKVATITEWASHSRYWTEAEGREHGLKMDCEHVSRSDRVFLLNRNGEGIVSSGMRVEAMHARGFRLEGPYNHEALVAVHDLTKIKFEDRAMIETIGIDKLPRWEG